MEARGQFAEGSQGNQAAPWHTLGVQRLLTGFLVIGLIYLCVFLDGGRVSQVP